MSHGRAISHDLIPDNILGYKEHDDFVLGMTNLVNTLMIMKYLPPEIMCGRLLCFNKDPSQIPTLDNIRPINIQSVVLKIIESLAFSELQNFIHNRRLLHVSQAGFRPHRSTAMNLISLAGAMMDIREEGSREGHVLFIDLKAAFDSVSHDILFQKLQNLGLREDIINLIKLIYSFAFTKLSHDSFPIPVNRGVLQGSLISPYLFNIYINDLLTDLAANDINALAYADDIACVCASSEQMEEALRTINRWCSENLIDLNTRKSGYFRIMKKRPSASSSMPAFHGIPFTKTYKYLGVHISNSGDLIEHIERLLDRIKHQALFWLRLQRNHISMKTRIELWQTFFRSFILYGMEIAPLHKTSWDRLERVYFATLRQAAKVHSRTSCARVLLASDQWSPEVLVLYRLLRLEDKYKRHFGKDFPSALATWMNTTCASKNLDLEHLRSLNRTNLVKELTKRSRKQILSALGLNKDVEISGDKSILLKTGDLDDNFVVKFYCDNSGNLIHYKKDHQRTIGSCPSCGSPGNQRHFANDCTIFDKERNELKKFMSVDFTTFDTYEFLMYYPFLKDACKDTLSVIKKFINHICTHTFSYVLALNEQ